MPPIRLTWEDPLTGDEQTLTAALPVSIGRAAENTLSLNSKLVSRRHARLEAEGNRVIIRDLGSTNGVLVNGRKVKSAALREGDGFKIGPFYFTVHPLAEAETPARDEKTLTAAAFDPDQTVPAARPPRASRFPPALFDEYQIVPLEALRALPYPLEETTYLTIGGGLGSFAWVDHLVIYGARPENVVAIGVEEKPYGRLQRLAANSQISESERLRSNSDACPDNLWGWPGYALREMWRDLRDGRFGHALHIAWQLFGEPDLAETYTPLAGDVFAAIEREAGRIGWPRIWRFGRVRAIRKTGDERYVVAYSQTGRGGGRVHKLILAPYLHIAVGYPAIRFLPDLRAYRERTRDFEHVVNAYEQHDHVYQHLVRHGGTVLVRGRGATAARVIQRVHEARARNADISVVHLMRAPVFEGSRFGRARRPVHHHWEVQPFNWPKACWGGDMRFLLERVPADERDQLLNDWGGITIAGRRDWIETIERGLQEGWYKIRFGQVESVRRENGKLATIIRGKTAIEGVSHLVADFIIDATGLAAQLEYNPLLRDLVEHYRLPRNVKNRLSVSTDFEVEGMRNGRGRVYASGSITLGSRFAPVDSFLGLQYAAQRSADHLVKEGAPGLRPFGMLRSVAQWLRWARGVSP